MILYLRYILLLINIYSINCFIPTTNFNPIYNKLSLNNKQSLIIKYNNFFKKEKNKYNLIMYDKQTRRDLLYYSTAWLSLVNFFYCIEINFKNSIKEEIINYDNKEIINKFENFQNIIFENVKESVCYISTEYNSMADKYNINIDDLPKGVGSGIIWDKEGHILTNFHVINKVDNAKVSIIDKYNNKKIYNAKLTGIDPDNDLAILKIDAPPDILKLIKYNITRKNNIGQLTYAIGNPFGQDHTLTTGIISGNNREIISPTGRTIYGIIQTDAAINPGNSGGPLINSNGELIGINTASLGMGVSAGIGFTIPIQNIYNSINDIINYGFVQRAILGISYMQRNPTITESKKSGIPIVDKGILILDVPNESPAFKAGLKGVLRDENTKKIINIGDIILSLNNNTINNSTDLNKILQNYKPNDIVNIKYMRNNIEYTTKLVLGNYKTSSFSKLENERGLDFDKDSKRIDIPLKDLEPVIIPKL